MQVFAAFAVGALVLGIFRLGPTDPMQSVAVVAGLVAAAAAGQGVLTMLRKGALRERYRAALQQYGREFGETEFFVAIAAANGRGLASEGRHFQRPSGFDRDYDQDVGDLTDRRRWAKEAELLAIVGELEDAPSRYMNGLLVLLVAGMFMTYRFVTTQPVYVEPPPPPAAEMPQPLANPPNPAEVMPPGSSQSAPELPVEQSIAMRFSLERCGSVRDAETSLRWFIGPDQTFQREDAERYIKGLRQCDRKWRLPTAAELHALYDPQHTAGEGYEQEGASFPAHLSPMFSNIGHGTWVWIGGSDYENAYNLHTGRPVTLSPDPGPLTVRVMVVSEP